MVGFRVSCTALGSRDGMPAKSLQSVSRVMDAGTRGDITNKLKTPVRTRFMNTTGRVDGSEVVLLGIYVQTQHDHVVKIMRSTHHSL